MASTEIPTLSTTIVSSLVLSYWDTYERPANGYYIFVGVAISIFALFGTCGNAIVIVIFLRSQQLRTVSNYFLLNLSVADFLQSSVCYPWMAAASFLGYWPFGHSVCALYTMLCGLCGFTSIATMAIIALDRCVAIRRCTSSAQISPPIRGSSFSAKTACLAITLTWLYSALLMVPPLSGWNRFVLDGMGVSCTFDYLSTDNPTDIWYVFFIFVLGFVAPLLIITVCYGSIIHEVVVHRRLIYYQGTTLQRRSLKRSMGLRVAKVVLVLVILFCLAWLPYVIVAMLAIFGGVRVSPLMQSLPALFAKAATTYNPVVYGISHPGFRRQLR